MKVNGRNDLVIATFLGIKGEAGRIPPLEIRKIDIDRFLDLVLLRIATIGINLAGNCC